MISGGRMRSFGLSPKVRVNSFSEVSDSILFENVQNRPRCRIRRAIIDKNVEIPPREVDRSRPRARQAALPHHDEWCCRYPQGA